MADKTKRDQARIKSNRRFHILGAKGGPARTEVARQLKAHRSTLKAANDRIQAPKKAKKQLSLDKSNARHGLYSTAKRGGDERKTAAKYLKQSRSIFKAVGAGRSTNKPRRTAAQNAASIANLKKGRSSVRRRR
jgi:hypothetical protein